MSGPGAIACVGGGMRTGLGWPPGAAPEFVADEPGVAANVRLPGEEACEVPAFDLSSR